MPRIRAGKNRITWCEFGQIANGKLSHLLAPVGRVSEVDIQLKRRAQADDHATAGQRQHFFQERKMIASFCVQ
jgi:hypothetical protein